MTLPLSEEKRKMIASLKQCCSFNVEYIDKADHSVVFSHPHRIAKIINRIRQTGDEMD